MTAPAERAALSALYWSRRGDAERLAESFAGLDQVELDLVGALLRDEHVRALSDAELSGRMLMLAGS